VAAAARLHTDPESQIAALARGFHADRGRGERSRLERLDDVLRGDPTVPVTLSHPLVHKEIRRLLVLQWELKRTCLMAVVSALQPTPRLVFVLRAILGLDLERIAPICDLTDDAVKVAWNRASLHLDDYLGPRCQHIDAENLCRCETRLGVALQQGFIRYPDHADELPDTPVAGATHRDVVSLYTSLPAVRAPSRPH
jgi:hypothetical protein